MLKKKIATIEALEERRLASEKERQDQMNAEGRARYGSILCVTIEPLTSQGGRAQFNLRGVNVLNRNDLVKKKGFSFSFF